MFTNRKGSTLHLAGALAFAFSGAGCLGAPDVQTETDSSTDFVNGTLVHTLDEGNGHTVSFYDFGDGRVGVREDLDPADHSLLEGASGGKASLAQLYRRVRAQGQIPSAILDADTRAASAISRLEKVHAAADPTWQPVSTAEPTLKPTSKPASGVESDVSEVKSAATVACSADFFGDNWGAQWFIDNFCHDFSNGTTCSRPLFLQVQHIENVSYTSNSAGGGYFFQYKQFEGDFNRAGTTKGYTTGWPYPTAHILWQGAVNPRKVRIWNVSGGASWQTNHVTGTSPCGHMMAAVVGC